MWATSSPEISQIRKSVPEFEDSFKLLIEEEEGEVESFEAMSWFASWLLERLHADPMAEEVERAFAAVERLATEAEFQLSTPLVTEFVEAVSNDSQAVLRLGQTSKGFLR